MRSRLLTFVEPRKGNQPGEAYVSRGRIKALYRMESDSFEGPNEAAEMHRKAFSLGKKRAFKVEMCLENDSVRSKVMPRNVGVGLKERGWAEILSSGWSCAS